MKKVSIYIALYLVFASASVFGQDSVAIKFASDISQENLRDYLTILSSDALEGRETATRGQKMAAAFIRQHFIDNGLKAIVPGCDKPGYLQHFILLGERPAQAWVNIDGKRYKNMESVIYSGQVNSDSRDSLPVVFVGPGTEEVLKQLDVRGKAVAGTPDGSPGGHNGFIARAVKAGAAMVFLVYTNKKTDFEQYVRQSALNYGQPSMVLPSAIKKDQIGYFTIPLDLAAKMLKVKGRALVKAGKKMLGNPGTASANILTSSVSFFTKQNYDSLTAENVLGCVEGTDKKDEFVFVTAHYDHLGRHGNVIFNGADDDGSGTSTVMELARVFAEAKNEGHGPRRSMVFMTVSGEEEGLLGSEYYSNNPVVPLKNTVVDLNIDMIGRIDQAHASDSNYVYIIGADKLSTELDSISERVNATYTHLDLDYTYNDDSDPNRFYYRSDHYNFAKHGVPIIFYFNGTHADYHRPTDTIEKIDFPMLQKRAQLVFHTAWELANRDRRPRIDGQ